MDVQVHVYTHIHVQCTRQTFDMDIECPAKLEQFSCRAGFVSGEIRRGEARREERIEERRGEKREERRERREERREGRGERRGERRGEERRERRRGERGERRAEGLNTIQLANSIG